MGKVIKLVPRAPKKTYTAPERLIENIRSQMFRSGRTNKELADKSNVSASTINNLMVGRTRWPRPTTLNPLLDTLGLALGIFDKSTGQKVDD